MSRKQTKRELENLGDLSVSLAPAAPKKSKGRAAASTGARTTRLATKQGKANNLTNIEDGSLAGVSDPAMNTTVSKTKQTRPKPKVAPTNSPDPDPTLDAIPTPSTISLDNSKPPNQSAERTDDSDQSELNQTPSVLQAMNDMATTANIETPNDEFAPPQASSPSKKSSRAKKPSAIAEKVNQQAATEQSTKAVKAKKKAKKAESVVIVETPEDTAAFLARAKGQSQPTKTSPAVTSPKRKKQVANRTKAMGQLLDSQIPSPNPSVVSGASAGTSSIAPDDSISQIGASKKNSKSLTKSHLQVPPLISSRDISPTAPPLSELSLPAVASRDISPGAESIITTDGNNDGGGVDYKALLLEVPQPWNVSPALPPPTLPEPFHTVKFNPEIMKKHAAAGTKPRVLVSNFREQDQAHLKLNLEYMDNLVLAVCAFPDAEARWDFAVLSNYWASKKLGRSYRIEQGSDHCRLLFSRISQSRGRLVTPAVSDGIRDNYKGLSWKVDSDAEQAAVGESIADKVKEMIESGSFLSPDRDPTAFYQNPWFERVLKVALWSGASSKGMSPDHAAYFGGGISYSLLALIVTATERMLYVVAAGQNAAVTHHKKPSNAFTYETFGHRFHSHLLTLAQIHRTPEAGPKLRAYLTEVHKRLRGVRPSPAAQGPTVKLAIPIAALQNYATGPETRTVAQVSTGSSSSRAAQATPALNPSSVIQNDALTPQQKLDILSVLYSVSEHDHHSANSVSSARQYAGLLTEVNADSDDSEVEARRAGALPDTRNDVRPATMAWATDSESDAIPEAYQAGSKSVDESEGDGDGEGTSAAEGRNKGATNEAHILSSSDEGDDSDAPLAPTSKARELKFFKPDGGLSSPYNSDEDDGSDGEGTSGVVVRQVDGDVSMVDAESDEEDVE
ncbi:hypothetical protein RhiJN_12457 [Ceratobasidium sp. AG-Ba]|nr:hypothetical protein RhiJN_12457 [Ceratobasidium sp. AG-Ba]QRW13054.1 hypothetical protein RhiLY_12053 [Ceratobasidium sp. AG-Ba]